MGIYSSMNKISGVALTVLLIAGLNYFVFLMLWCGFRTIGGKTLNLPPSRRKWQRMRAEAVQTENGKYQASYYFGNTLYTAKIDGFTVYGDKALIYVNRKNPVRAKEFVPLPPMNTETCLSCFFIAGVILLFEFVLFI